MRPEKKDGLLTGKRSRPKGFVVTIDGPAASGKSTTARLVAEKRGWIYLDTGAMYRALSVAVLDRGLPLDKPSAIGRLAGKVHIELNASPAGTQVKVDGKDVTSRIRLPEIDRAVGPVCEIRRVREVMVTLQRKIASGRDLVAEGRDMGTVVFPDADLKFFMIASMEARARRRQKELEAKGIHVNLSDVMREIEERDKRDSEREHSPLMKAKDAIEIDTTRLSIDEQADFILDRINRKRDLK